MAAGYLRTALFVGKAPLNIPAGATVNGFVVEGQQPGQSERRVIFRVGNGYYKFAGNTPTAINPTLTADWVLKNGNTVAELQAVTSIADWAGQNIYPIFALSAPEDDTVAPTIKLGVKYTVGSDTFEKQEESPELTLSDVDVPIVSINADVATTGDATCIVEARLFANGVWGEYQTLDKYANARASKLQFRATYRVAGVGSGTAKVIRAAVTYAGTAAKITEATTEIFTQTKRYELGGGDGLHFVQALCVHDKLVDAQVKAYCSFRDAPKQAEYEQVGVASGSQDTVKLPGTGIYQETIELRANGTPFWDFGFNMETNEVTYAVTAGEVVTASFEHGWTDENWREMEHVTQQPYEASGRYATRFNFALPEAETGKTIVAVKFALIRPGGTVTDEVLGIATGDMQSFRLPHYARADTITCTGQWTYDDETRQLLVLAGKGTEIKVSYTWVAESPKVYDIACGWAELG